MSSRVHESPTHGPQPCKAKSKADGGRGCPFPNALHADSTEELLEKIAEQKRESGEFFSALSKNSSALDTISDAEIEKLYNDEADADLLEKFNKAIIEDLEKEFPHGVDLIYVDYRDELNDEDIELLLSGQEDKVYENIWEHSEVGFQSIDQAEEILQDVLSKRGIDKTSLPHEYLEPAKDKILDMDTSDPVRDLKRNTPAKLMRNQLISSKVWYDDDELYEKINDDTDYEKMIDERVNFIESQLRSKGVINNDLSREDRDAIKLMVYQGPPSWHEGVTLDAIWFGEIDEVALSNPDETRVVTTSHSGANIVLLDPWNGSGDEAQILSSNLNLTFTKDNPATLDSQTNGYGWDEIAGLVHSAYRTDFNDVEK